MPSSDAVSPSIPCQPYTISRPAQVGESRHDGLLADPSKPQEVHRLDNWTISWEAAIRREHEYRDRVKILQQHAGISESPPAESQVDDKLGSLQMLKGDMPQQQSLSTPPLHSDSCPLAKKTSRKKRRHRQPQSLQSSQVGQNPMLGQMHILQVPEQSSQAVHIPMPRQTPILHTTNHLLPNNWCHVCKINCGTEANLLLHLHGQKHRMNLSKVNLKKSLLEKGFVWCKECNIPCTNLSVLGQHRLGKKHLVRIETLAKYKAHGATAMLPGVDTHRECQ